MNSFADNKITPPSLWRTFDCFEPGENLWNVRVGLCIKTTDGGTEPYCRLVNLASGQIVSPQETETFIPVATELRYNPAGM
jgi:hypothetical protein